MPKSADASTYSFVSGTHSFQSNSSKDRIMLDAFDEAFGLVNKAQAAELNQNYHSALELYSKSLDALKKYINSASKKSESRRRAKLQVKSMTERRELLEHWYNDPKRNAGSRPLALMPSSITNEQETLSPSPGMVPLSIIERRIGTVPPSTPSATDPFTPSLPLNRPPTKFHIYHEHEPRWSGISWNFVHVRDTTDTTTIYTFTCPAEMPEVSADTMHNIQLCTMFRAAEYNEPVANVSLDLSKIEYSAAQGLINVRCGPLRIMSSSGTKVLDVPDYVEGGWTPRRFTYGGRKFVWKGPPRPSMYHIEDLYEVKQEARSGGKEVLFERKLVWGEWKATSGQVATINMVAGLDQMFREFLLADMVGRLIVSSYFPVEENGEENTEGGQN